MTDISASTQIRDQFLSQLVGDQLMHPATQRLASLHFFSANGWDEEVVARATAGLAHFRLCEGEEISNFLVNVRDEMPLDFGRALDLRYILTPFLGCDSAAAASIDLLIIMTAFRKPDLLPT